MSSSSASCVYSVFVARVKGHTASQDTHLPLFSPRGPFPPPPSLPKTIVLPRTRRGPVQSTIPLSTPERVKAAQSKENAPEILEKQLWNVGGPHNAKICKLSILLCLITSFSKRWLVCCAKLCNACSVDDKITQYQYVYSLLFFKQLYSHCSDFLLSLFTNYFSLIDCFH